VSHIRWHRTSGKQTSLLNSPLRDQGAGSAGARPASGAGAPFSARVRASTDSVDQLLGSRSGSAACHEQVPESEQCAVNALDRAPPRSVESLRRSRRMPRPARQVHLRVRRRCSEGRIAGSPGIRQDHSVGEGRLSGSRRSEWPHPDTAPSPPSLANPLTAHGRLGAHAGGV
jgi:hypothetical protein